MASKKCPKCGEDNPTEAVMCWACYTPLAGNAVLGGLAGASVGVGTLPNAPAGKPIGVPTGTVEPAKKGIDPKIIGVGAFLLVAVIAGVLMSGALGGGTPVDEVTPGNPTPSGRRVPSGSIPSGSLGPAIPSGLGGGGGSQVAVSQTYKVVAPPNPEFATATIGIQVDAGLAPTQALSFARIVRDQMTPNGKWTEMQIAVFIDPNAATSFASYQNKRKGAPLEDGDFSQLATSNVWQGAPVYMESRGKQEKTYTPSSNPSAWWPRR